jgi:hypothetical protein
MISLNELIQNRDVEKFQYFNDWVMDFFKREVLRETGKIKQYKYSKKFGPAMREEVSYWNPNRSKHAEVYWLENYVFNQNTSLRNKILNAMAVKFVGMPTLTLVATNSTDYSNIIDFDEYKKKGVYYHEINQNLDENVNRLKVWGATQLQTSLQTAARNFCRIEDNNEKQTFSLSNMIRWINHLDELGMSKIVINTDSNLESVSNWFRTHHGIGPYYAYHPPCNFSRCDILSHIDEDEDFCLVGPGAKRGLEYVFPKVRFNESLLEEYVIAIKKNQFNFFNFKKDDLYYYKENLERGGRLTTFGVEITFCQFNCFLSIKDNPKAQTKRILPLTFESFELIAKSLKTPDILIF